MLTTSVELAKKGTPEAPEPTISQQIFNYCYKMTVNGVHYDSFYLEPISTCVGGFTISVDACIAFSISDPHTRYRATIRVPRPFNTFSVLDLSLLISNTFQTALSLGPE